MPLARHDLVNASRIATRWSFYSHASCEAWLPLFALKTSFFVVSTHMPLARHDNSPLRFSAVLPFLLTCLLRGMTVNASRIATRWSFYSHASCEAWPCLRGINSAFKSFLLTCLLRGMTTLRQTQLLITIVSTHMPLARHDSYGLFQTVAGNSFYSHASCEAWRACRQVQWLNDCFYSHASCEAWHWISSSVRSFIAFLLTCLLRGMTVWKISAADSCEFLLTCLLRGMTWRSKRKQWRDKFLLTCLLRGMTVFVLLDKTAFPFLLTCLLRGMTRRARRRLSRPAFLLTCLLRGMTNGRRTEHRTAGFLLTCLLRGMTAVLFPIYTPFRFLLTCLLRGMTPRGQVYF